MEAVETYSYSKGKVLSLQVREYVYLVRVLLFLGILVLFSKKKISTDKLSLNLVWGSMNQFEIP